MRLLTSAVLALFLLPAGQSSAPLLAQDPRPAGGQRVTSFDVLEKSIEELQRALSVREVTSRELVDLYLARIDAYDQPVQRPTRSPALAPVD